MLRLMRNFVTLTLIAGAALAQDSTTSLEQYFNLATAAYQQQDFETYYSRLTEAKQYYPDHPVLNYNLACGAALTGRHEQALQLLRSLADRKIDYGAEHDPDLQALNQYAAFDSLVAVWATMFEPVLTSSRRYVHPQIDIMPEGMAVDPRTGITYFGSMRFGTIYAVDTTGAMVAFASANHDYPLSVLGLEVDTVRNRLWACTRSFFLHADYDAEHGDRSALLWFSLENGHLGGSYFWPEPREAFGFNDLEVTTNGDVYMSGNGLFQLPFGDTIPRRFPLENPIPGSNGIALTDDEQHLYLTYSGHGLVRINLASKDWQSVTSPDNLELLGIDGLYLYKGSLVGIQNGIRPWRVMRLHLAEDGLTVTSSDILEIKNPDLTGATTGAIVGDTLYYVARTRLSQPPPATSPTLAPFVGATHIMQTSLTGSAQAENGL